MKQLKLDTLAFFFTEKDFKGPTMLMLPAATTEIFDFLQDNQHIDVLTPSDLNAKRIKLFSALKSILQVFQLGQVFLTEEAKSAAEMIFQVIGFIADKGTSVIDSTGAIAVLEDSIYAKNLMGDLFGKKFYESFDNHISSLILIGFPYSRTGTVVKCYVNRNFNLNKGEENGRVLELKIPDGCFIAAIRDMENPALSYPVPFLNNTYVDPPMNMPQGSNRNFNDQINSVRFETHD